MGKIHYNYYSVGMVVNFICQLIGLWYAPVVGKMSSLGLCVCRGVYRRD